MTLKEIRLSKHMTQEYVAHAINVSPMTYHNWENHSHAITTVNRDKLIELFKAEPTDLAVREVGRPKWIPDS